MAPAAGPRRPAARRLRAFQRLLRSYALFLVLLPLRILPERQARAIGALYGELAHWLLPGLRRRSRRHLALAFPDWSPAQVKRTARAVPRWIGRAGADFLHLGGPRADALFARIEAEGWEHWRTTAGSGQGIVAITGHYGNWELLGAWLVRLGCEVTVLYHPLHEERLDRWVLRWRRASGVRALPADPLRPEALRALRRGGVLGVLIDRIPRGPSVPCRFFSRDCRAAAGPARLALAARSPILPVMLRYEGKGYRARFEAPIRVEASEQIEAVTQRLAAVLEGWIREAPEQWPWFEDRWKMRPGARS